MKRKVILRADGNPRIGMGHFVRMLALAEMLSDDFYCIYATQHPTDYQINEIDNVCEEWVKLSTDKTHFDFFLNFLKGDEIVVLDNYYFDTEYQRKIISKGCKLVCIDDLHDKHYVADVVINHSEGIKESKFSKEDYTKVFTGLKYALLRSPFLQVQANNKEIEFDILIGIGGADSQDISSKIARKVLNGNRKYRIATLLGGAYSGELLHENNFPIKIFKSLEADKVAELMCSSNIGIFPASSVAIEAIATRLPFLSFSFVKNQIRFYEFLEKNEMVLPFNYQVETSYEEILNNLNYLSNNYTNYKLKYEKLIDLRSPKRILEIFKILNYEE